MSYVSCCLCWVVRWLFPGTYLNRNSLSNPISVWLTTLRVAIFVVISGKLRDSVFPICYVACLCEYCKILNYLCVNECQDTSFSFWSIGYAMVQNLKFIGDSQILTKRSLYYHPFIGRDFFYQNTVSFCNFVLYLETSIHTFTYQASP